MSMNNDVWEHWDKFLNRFESHRSNSKAGTINNETNVFYDDYIVNLKRNNISVEDYKTVLNNRHNFEITYSKDRTWMTKDGKEMPKEASGVASFFD